MKRLVVVLALVVVSLTACNKSNNKGDTEGRFFVPGYLPPGMKIVTGAIQQVGPSSKAFGAVIGQPAQADSFTGVILALASQAAADRQVSPTEQVTPVDVNGVKGRSHDDSLHGAYVDWFAHGLAIAVSGPAGALTTVLDVARKITLPADNNTDGVALGPLPSGYQTIASGHFTDRSPEAGETVQVGQAPGPSFKLVGIVTNAPLLVAMGGGDTVQVRTVRGKRAFATYRSRAVAPDSQARVVEGALGWEERPGIVLSVISNTDPDRLQPIADGVRAVTEAQFRHEVPVTTAAP